MTGFVDLHLHYLPAVDDGVRTFEEGVSLCQGLARLGYTLLVTTPHIRTAMYDNRADDLRRHFERFVSASGAQPGMPQLGLGAEHFFDDVFLGLFERKEIVPYPGGHAALIELPESQTPLGLEDMAFRMNLKGVTPVIAHPERHFPLFRNHDALERWLELGIVAQLDLMSLVGRYGSKPQRAAQRMLEDGLYAVAASDAHRPTDVELVDQALRELRALIGDSEAQSLLADRPRRLLAGKI